MNNKSNIILIILILCILSLVLGIFNTIIKSIQTSKLKTKNTESMSKILDKNKVALITLNGVIEAGPSRSGYMFSDNFSANNVLKAIKDARTDSSIKAVILKLNTPGGTVGMSQNIYDAIIRLRKIKPVVVFMDDTAASGGYYIASAADRIVAQGGTLTGSIGVIFSTLDIHQLLQNKLSIESNVVKSGKFKDIGSGLRKMTPDDKAIISDIVNDSYNQFLNAIIVGRINRDDKYSVPKQNLKIDTLNKYADGRVFTGLQAKSLGFIDYIGDIDFAYDIALNMASEKFRTKFKKLPLEPYYGDKYFNFNEMVFSLSSKFLEFNSNSSLTSSIESGLPVSIRLSHKPLYLWE